MINLTSSLLLTLALFQLFIRSLSHECIHDKLTHNISIVDSSRTLQEEGEEGGEELSFKPIKIHVVYDIIRDLAIYPYVINDLMPPVLDYFQNTIKVKSSGKIRIQEKSHLCNLNVSDNYLNYTINADFIIIMRAENREDATYAGFASPCSINSIGRPIVSQVLLNLRYINGEDDDIDYSIQVMFHELIHTFGMNKALFPYFLGDSETGEVDIRGVTQTYFTASPAQERLQEYFDCDDIVGMLLENQGPRTSSGNHLERRVFGNELMTSTVFPTSKLSIFTLVFLESSGFYEVDYSMADDFIWGKGQGCGFIEEACFDSDEQVPNFEEFCPIFGERGCSFDRREIAQCGKPATGVNETVVDAFNYYGNLSVVGDKFADNCPYFHASIRNSDCFDSDSRTSNSLEIEEFGLDSRCFAGDLAPNGNSSLQKFNFCFQFECENDGGTYKLLLKLFDKDIECEEEGEVTVEGYDGHVDCPDPQTFCEKHREQSCLKGCAGRGTCENGRCQCEQDYYGNWCQYSDLEYSETADEEIFEGCCPDGGSILQVGKTFMLALIIILVILQ